MEPHECRVCGKSIPADERPHTCVVRLTDVRCRDIVTLDMIFCETCHQAVYTPDLLEAAEKAIVAELHEALNTRITTRQAKETNDGD